MSNDQNKQIKCISRIITLFYQFPKLSAHGTCEKNLFFEKLGIKEDR